MTEREVIPVVCVYAAGADDGYPHLEGLFVEGHEYVLVRSEEEDEEGVYLVKDEKVPFEWSAIEQEDGVWTVEGLELIAEFEEL